jgi:hypothetical protein
MVSAGDRTVCNEQAHAVMTCVRLRYAGTQGPAHARRKRRASVQFQEADLDAFDAGAAAQNSNQARGESRPSRRRVRRQSSDLSSFGDLMQYHPLRRLCIRISNNADFEAVVMFAIVVNCLTLSLHRPLEPDDSQWNKQLFWAGVGREATDAGTDYMVYLP